VGGQGCLAPERVCAFPFWALRPPCTHSGLLSQRVSQLPAPPRIIFASNRYMHSLLARASCDVTRWLVVCAGLLACIPIMPVLHSVAYWRNITSHASCLPTCHSPGSCFIDGPCRAFVRTMVVACTLQVLGRMARPAHVGALPKWRWGKSTQSAPPTRYDAQRTRDSLAWLCACASSRHVISSIFASVQCAIMT
jgi:hypothetical protein